MSEWRKEASSRLSELQTIISSPGVDSPMGLWIELNIRFETLCSETPPPIDLLKRIWSYGLWCLEHPDQNVSTAAALGFFEHLIDTKDRISLLNQLTSKKTMEGFRGLLAYHSTPEEIESAFHVFRT